MTSLEKSSELSWTLPRRGAARFSASSPDGSIDMLLVIPRDGCREGLCLQGHRLLPHSTLQDGYACDRCKTRFPTGTMLFGCRRCDWDLCASCCDEVNVVELVDRGDGVPFHSVQLPELKAVKDMYFHPKKYEAIFADRSGYIIWELETHRLYFSPHVDPSSTAAAEDEYVFVRELHVPVSPPSAPPTPANMQGTDDQPHGICALLLPSPPQSPTVRSSQSKPPTATEQRPANDSQALMPLPPLEEAEVEVVSEPGPDAAFDEAPQRAVADPNAGTAPSIRQLVEPAKLPLQRLQSKVLSELATTSDAEKAGRLREVMSCIVELDLEMRSLADGVAGSGDIEAPRPRQKRLWKKLQAFRPHEDLGQQCREVDWQGAGPAEDVLTLHSDLLVWLHQELEETRTDLQKDVRQKLVKHAESLETNISKLSGKLLELEQRIEQQGDSPWSDVLQQKLDVHMDDVLALHKKLQRQIETHSHDRAAPEESRIAPAELLLPGMKAIQAELGDTVRQMDQQLQALHLQSSELKQGQRWLQKDVSECRRSLEATSLEVAGTASSLLPAREDLQHELELRAKELESRHSQMERQNSLHRQEMDARLSEVLEQYNSVRDSVKQLTARLKDEQLDHHVQLQSAGLAELATGLEARCDEIHRICTSGLEECMSKNKTVETKHGKLQETMLSWPSLFEGEVDRKMKLLREVLVARFDEFEQDTGPKLTCQARAVEGLSTDLRQLSQRLGAVEKGCEGAAAEASRSRDLVHKVERLQQQCDSWTEQVESLQLCCEKLGTDQRLLVSQPDVERCIAEELQHVRLLHKDLQQESTLMMRSHERQLADLAKHQVKQQLELDRRMEGLGRDAGNAADEHWQRLLANHKAFIDMRIAEHSEELENRYHRLHRGLCDRVERKLLSLERTGAIIKLESSTADVLAAGRAALEAETTSADLGSKAEPLARRVDHLQRAIVEKQQELRQEFLDVIKALRQEMIDRSSSSAMANSPLSAPMMPLSSGSSASPRQSQSRSEEAQCACGSRFCEDAVYCRRCGRQRLWAPHLSAAAALPTFGA
eukprot:TRINITY_DN39512_c0_g1_i1.p1 TRINITY_DN39512_c0_g1~~TRINITY_DN39512_c0_g1_i1.p1  ORF type:complete len:1056 (-),score=231.60 TRINITY_DN39512_c0_g1_i1:92-3259(-)